MMGVEVHRPTKIYCDSKAVMKCCLIPESMLKMKHHLIAYHRNKQSLAAGTCQIANKDTATNLADAFTEVMSSFVIKIFLTSLCTKLIQKRDFLNSSAAAVFVVGFHFIQNRPEHRVLA